MHPPHLQAKGLPQLVVLAEGPEEPAAAGQARQVACRQLLEDAQQCLIGEQGQEAQPGGAHAAPLSLVLKQPQRGLHAMRVLHAGRWLAGEQDCGPVGEVEIGPGPRRVVAAAAAGGGSNAAAVGHSAHRQSFLDYSC